MDDLSNSEKFILDNIEKVTGKRPTFYPFDLKRRDVYKRQLFGQCANMEAVLKVAKEHQLYVIEDNAQAIGADFTFSDGIVKKSGTMGILGTTSFFPSKNLGCYGDGGAIFTNDDELAHKIRGIVNHGMYCLLYTSRCV